MCTEVSTTYMLLLPPRRFQLFLMSRHCWLRQQVKFSGIKWFLGVVFRWGGPVTLNLPGIVLVI
jgi:hypothetical protein